MENIILVGIDNINRSIIFKNKENEYFLIEDKGEFTVKGLYEKEVDIFGDISYEQYWKEIDMTANEIFTDKCKKLFYGMFI